MKKKIIISIVIVELIAVIVLAFVFLNARNSVAGAITGEFLSFPSPGGGYQYYYEHLPDVIIGKDTFGKSVYNINSDTLNSVKDYSVQKPANTYRIITLGDSWTFGLYVNTEDNWPSVLERKLNSTCKGKNYEVINLAVEGYDTAYSLERYRRRGTKYKPDLVLWMHVDMFRYMEAILPSINKITSPKDGERRWKQGMDSLFKKYSHEELFYIQEAKMKKIRDYYKGKLGFVLSSTVGTYKGELHKLVKKINGFSVDLPELKSDAIVKGDTHPNKKGQAIIAETVFSDLLHNKRIPCKLN